MSLTLFPPNKQQSWPKDLGPGRGRGGQGPNQWKPTASPDILPWHLFGVSITISEAETLRSPPNEFHSIFHIFSFYLRFFH